MLCAFVVNDFLLDHTSVHNAIGSTTAFAIDTIRGIDIRELEPS